MRTNLRNSTRTRARISPTLTTTCQSIDSTLNTLKKASSSIHPWPIYTYKKDLQKDHSFPTLTLDTPPSSSTPRSLHFPKTKLTEDKKRPHMHNQKDWPEPKAENFLLPFHRRCEWRWCSGLESTVCKGSKMSHTESVCSWPFPPLSLCSLPSSPNLGWSEAGSKNVSGVTNRMWGGSDSSNGNANAGAA